jgi:hypothetical protein
MKIAARSFLAICLIAALFASQGAKPALAACTAPGTDYGAAATSLTAPTTATYRIWTRMMVPDTSNKTYLLELDGGSCFNVGLTTTMAMVALRYSSHCHRVATILSSLAMRQALRLIAS